MREAMNSKLDALEIEWKVGEDNSHIHMKFKKWIP